MADQKISQLTDGGNAQATDEYVIARSGANYRIDGASVAAAATSVGTLTSLTVSGDLTVDTNTLYVGSANNRVGVGTASPSDKLAVVGASGDGISYTDSTRKVLLGTSSGLGGGYVGTTTNDAFLFLTNTAEKMRLDASGNLGLGVTPSANDYTGALQLKWIGHSITPRAVDNLAVSMNAYHQGGGWKYGNNGVASLYLQNSGSHTWFTAASGTAGNAITFTQAMTLDASGNLLVGETTQAYLSRATFAYSASSNNGPISVDTRAYNVTPSGAFWMGGKYNAAGSYRAFAGFGGTKANTTDGDSSGFLQFYVNKNATDPSEAARITSGGYFKASNTGAYVGSTGAYHELRGDAAGQAVVMDNFAGSGNVGVLNMRIPTFSPDNNTSTFLIAEDSTAQRCIIYSDGDLANHDGVYGTISDERLKQDIVDAGSQWDDLKAVRFRKYRMKTDVEANPDAPFMLGVVAQEIEVVSPGLVDEHPNEDGTTTKTVKSSILLMKAAVALQEAMARIEALEVEVAALKAGA